ncbi:4'-phosphopantetheinyl transferase family protein [Shewanella maritima]|uniref:4'-phosphopantetheinyl transferase family protein n=1 Tax=Shewanella maritima TaxID=2520507 RepID=UPI003734F69B
MSPLPTIQLFFCPLDTNLLDEKTVSIVRSWLSDAEINKVDRFIQHAAQQQGLMVRGYLRSVLSSFVNIEPDEWQFEYGEKGKPRLSAVQYKQTGLQFNLSHSGNWLLIGVIHSKEDASMPIQLGVDIERRRESTNIHSILHHYFSKPEEAALLVLPESQQRERFFDLWALKESFIKATGLGLSLSLKAFSFDLENIVWQWLAINQQEATNPIEASVTDKQYFQISSQVTLQINRHLLDNNNTYHSQLKCSDESHWRCFLGRLDEEYRFAMSVYFQHQGTINDAAVLPNECSERSHSYHGAQPAPVTAKFIDWSNIFLQQRR